MPLSNDIVDLIVMKMQNIGKLLRSNNDCVKSNKFLNSPILLQRKYTKGNVSRNKKYVLKLEQNLSL